MAASPMSPAEPNHQTVEAIAHWLSTVIHHMVTWRWRRPVLSASSSPCMTRRQVRQFTSAMSITGKAQADSTAGGSSSLRAKAVKAQTAHTTHLAAMDCPALTRNDARATAIAN